MDRQFLQLYDRRPVESFGDTIPSHSVEVAVRNSPLVARSPGRLDISYSIRYDPCGIPTGVFAGAAYGLPCTSHGRPTPVRRKVRHNEISNTRVATTQGGHFHLYMARDWLDHTRGALNDPKLRCARQSEQRIGVRKRRRANRHNMVCCGTSAKSRATTC